MSRKTIMCSLYIIEYCMGAARFSNLLPQGHCHKLAWDINFVESKALNTVIQHPCLLHIIYHVTLTDSVRIWALASLSSPLSGVFTHSQTGNQVMANQSTVCFAPFHRPRLHRDFV